MNENIICCPIWGTRAQQIYRDIGALTTEYFSERAGGKFIIDDYALYRFGFINEQNRNISINLHARVKLSTFILQENLRGHTPRITREMFDQFEKAPILSLEDRSNLLMKTIYKRHPEIGRVFQTARQSRMVWLLSAAIEWTYNDYYVDADPDSALPNVGTAVTRYCEQAVEDGYMEKHSNFEFSFTINGLKYVEALGFQLNQNDQIFVAMWFGDNKLRKLYEKAIRPAIRAAGYNEMRIDDSEHNEKIDDEIIAEIRKSKALIADITCGLSVPDADWSTAEKVGAPRGGVFYEAGFAKGLGLPVIWTVDEKIIEIENVSHFDIRQYNQIRWGDNFEETKKRIQNRIEATLGRGNVVHKM